MKGLPVFAVVTAKEKQICWMRFIICVLLKATFPNQIL
jgi:hypothetical protein